jgi:hypothetical protein
LLAGWAGLDGAIAAEVEEQNSRLLEVYRADPARLSWMRWEGKMIIRKIAIVAVVCFALVAAACGGDNSSESAEAPSQVTVTDLTSGAANYCDVFTNKEVATVVPEASPQPGTDHCMWMNTSAGRQVKLQIVPDGYLSGEGMLPELPYEWPCPDAASSSYEGNANGAVVACTRNDGVLFIVDLHAIIGGSDLSEDEQQAVAPLMRKALERVV